MQRLAYVLARDVRGTPMYLARRSGSNLMEDSSPLEAMRFETLRVLGDFVDRLPTRETLAEKGHKLSPNDLSHREEFDGGGYKAKLLRFDIDVVETVELTPKGRASAIATR